MPILSGDIKLQTSSVMADVPEGGGGPTGQSIDDGVSNAIFPDVSSADRAMGRTSLRQVHVAVQTDDVDTFLGANVIVAEPPLDPRVAISIFSTGETFDTRTNAQQRIESFLALGSRYQGLLFGNHVSGMMSVLIFQQLDRALPSIGQVLVLQKNSGLSNELQQYVRITTVSSVVLTFTDETGDYQRRVVTCQISDPLRADFTGFEATRKDSNLSYVGKTELYQTIVANAARYYGVKPLTQAASVGALQVHVGTPYSSLIPSAQIETPIADARTNNRSTMLVSAGEAIVFDAVRVRPTQNVFIGSAVLPGSFSAIAGSATITDSGGKLFSGGVEIGSIDYANGILSAAIDVFGVSGTMTGAYTPAVTPTTTYKSIGIPITVSNRSMSYAVTLMPLPARGSLEVSYLAMGEWYVLRDDGSGTVRGSDSAFGAGVLNLTTGTLSITLGALPDVGSVIILQYGEAATVLPSVSIPLQNDGKLFSEYVHAGPIAPLSLSLTWTDGAVVKTATDSNGAIVGDATGTVDYRTSTIRLTPTTLPAHGTAITANVTSAPTVSHSLTLNVTHGANATATGTFGGVVRAGTVRMTVGLTRSGGNWELALPPAGAVLPWEIRQKVPYDTFLVVDDGAGVLVCGANPNVGTINYANGDFTLSFPADGHPYHIIKNIPLIYQAAMGVGTSAVASTHPAGYYGALGAALDIAATATAATAVGSSASFGWTLDSMIAEPQFQAAGHTLQGVMFSLGSDRFVSSSAGVLTRNPNTATGVGTAVGSVTAGTGRISLNSWVAGTTTAITGFRAIQAPPPDGVGAIAADSAVMFRTASAPLRPASLQILGTMEDGTAINVTANANGEINTARVKGKVNVETGVVQLYFCNPSPTVYGTTDASGLGIIGVGTINTDIVRPNTLRYNAVAYTYLPLDADLLGIDPVRLPTDGRVPIYNAGGIVVVGHTGRITASVSNGQTINCARVRLSRVRVVGNDGIVINTGYTTDLEAGTVTFTNVAGYSQPVTVEHRIEDMALVRDVQINGTISLTSPLTHDYPAAGVGERGAFVSSALMAGDVFARVSSVYDQQTWTGVWSDELIGSAATATYNHALYPITVTNRGAVTERWMLRFTNTTSFEVVGEHVGIIATGNTATNCAPTNPATGAPYFTLPALGWGAGWAAGNILRVNTVGAQVPVWVVRTVQQGPETVPDDSFTLLIRGDVDRP